MILGPMSGMGKEPIGSMGNDTPLAALSHQSQHLANYFKQLFAQVTNPPIDSIRERLVMSLVTYVGSQLNILEEDPKQCHVVSIRQPVLTSSEERRVGKESVITGKSRWSAYHSKKNK